MPNQNHPARPGRALLAGILISAAASLLAGRPAAADDPPATGPGPEKPEPAKPRRVLRISADPNNLPFTNERLEGFENKIADLLAREMDADLLYIWRAQRRGFFRSSLKEGECDLVLGVPSGFDPALTTASYYRSSYVFASRKDRGLKVRSLDDPALRDLKIGVQLIGDDGTNTPPAHALASRGLVDNVVGYTVYGDYARESPPARIVEAVAARDVDIAIVWGPMVGYFAKRGNVALDLVPVTPEVDVSGLPFVFDIGMGVRKGNKPLRDEIDGILVRKRDEIGKILDDYGVPRQPLTQHGKAGDVGRRGDAEKK